MDTAFAIPPARGGKAEIDLALEGMTCAACAARIEKTLNRVPGVEAHVNFATESARVRYAPSQANADALVAAVKRAGYAARVRRDEDEERARESVRRHASHRALRRDLLLAVALTVPLIAQLIAMLISGSATDEFLPRWLQLALATPVQFVAGRRFYVGAWRALRGGGANMDVLIALGTSIAWVSSAVVTLAGLHGHVYFEASATIVTLVLSASCSNRAHGRGLQPPSRVCCAWRPRSRTSSVTAARSTCRSRASWSATTFASAQAKRYPSTVSSSRAARRPTKAC